MFIDWIRVLIANNQLQVREYLTMVLSHEPDMKIVGSVESSTLAVEQSLKLKPNVVLIDIRTKPPWLG